MKKNIKRSKGINFFYLVIKRVFDIVGAITGLILLVPVIVIVKIAYMITGDFNSILYTQKRIGKNGKEFNLFKFRSMVIDADEVLEELLKNNKAIANEYKVNKKIENDPRITKVGKLIRRTSIDELPQVLNILFNQMSFIGNRPYLLKEKKDMGKYFNDIVRTKPGLSGYWQVSLRSRGTFEQRLKMEQYYSNNCNLWFDIKIFFKTFIVIFDGKSAQ
jgi:undecaprenyl-phosphate galactose phosphotransferase